MKNACLLGMLIYCCTLSAQQKSTAFIGIDTDIVDLDKQAYLYDSIQEELFFDGQRFIETDVIGFKTLHLGLIQIPVHIEPGDDFDFVVLNDLLLKNAYFNGNQGAVKNNYIYSKYHFLKELELKPDFKNANEAVVTARIVHVKDSMLQVAKNLALSDQFIKDEQFFWDAYQMYHSVFHGVLRAPVYSPLEVVPVSEMRVSGQDFLNEYYFDIPYYKVLGYHYHIQKLHEAIGASEKRNVLRGLENSSHIFAMLEWMESQIYHRNPQAAMYRNLLINYTDNYDILENITTVKNIHDKKPVGSLFPPVYLKDTFDDVKLYKDFGQRRVALFLYSKTDGNLLENIALWNQFCLDSKNKFAHFVTICIDNDMGTINFEDIVKDNVYGAHFAVKRSTGQALLYDIGQFVIPAVLTIESNKSISNFNTLPNMFNSNVFFDNKSAFGLLPKLGGF